MLGHLILPLAQAATPDAATEESADIIVKAQETSQQVIDYLIAFATSYGMNIIGAIIILVIGSMVSKFVSKRVEGFILKSPSTDSSIAAIARKVSYAGLMTIVIIIVLGKFGVETASLIAVLGTAGLAIGLALQGTLSNIAAGVMILILKPFKAGNAVKIAGGDVYLVDQIGLFVTHAHQPDCPRVMIPNSKIWGNIIVNFSDTDQGLRRFDIPFGISYGDDINAALEILEKLAADDPRVKTDPAPFIKVDSLGDSSVNILFRVYTAASDWWPAKLELTKAGKEALEAGGLTIPFPQQDVYMHQVSESKS
ncbi:mechanosensitive ion channel family protein [Pelagicoccus sp. SDUM812003]|uniref:mechanosensitive ion channel family protein n=1 Tax=Pelagicoccus sp. SDUM812003 TaxID=3041267 RepID=UPI00280D5CE8|nr:mechanosensitive ion channel family protein [Pelagicoccus sp. SDUM812003]MDQ8204806.1 mechanosensitive ion channel family protein [Pelagicoccus sp. SDUM812003]